jgi:hypothetical protein
MPFFTPPLEQKSGEKPDRLSHHEFAEIWYLFSTPHPILLRRCHL